MRQPFQQYEKTCKVCGKKFQARRAHAEFCGSTCRTTYVRNREKELYEQGGEISGEPQAPAVQASTGTGLQMDDVDAYIANYPRGAAYDLGISQEEARAKWIEWALPEQKISEMMQTLAKRLVNAKNNYGESSLQYKHALDALCVFNPPRIKSDGSVWIGTSRIR